MPQAMSHITCGPFETSNVGSPFSMYFLESTLRNPNHTIKAFVGNWVVCTQLVQLLASWHQESQDKRDKMCLLLYKRLKMVEDGRSID